MTLFRLITAFALVVGLTGAAPALAGDQGLYGGPVVSRPGLPLDPQLLPANTAPGDCVTRRMTGPGGAYRWDRIECEGGQDYREQGWNGHDQWGYGRALQGVETRGASPAGYACDRCAAPAPNGCDPCTAASAGYYDPRIDAFSRAQVQGYPSGYQAHFQGGYDTVCIQGCVPQGYVQGYASPDGDRYGPAPTYAYNTDYAVSGRDEAGYLVWPGKRP